MAFESLQPENIGGVPVTPFSSSVRTQNNHTQVLIDRGNGIVSKGIDSLFTLSLLYNGKSRNHVGLFNDSKPPTTVSIFNSLSTEERVDVVLRSLSMKQNMDAYPTKTAKNYLTLITLIENAIDDILAGTFRMDDYKYTLINASKRVVRVLQQKNINHGGIGI